MTWEEKKKLVYTLLSDMFTDEHGPGLDKQTLAFENIAKFCNECAEKLRGDPQ